MTFKPYPLLTLFAAISVVILVMFGNWQWAKYEARLAAAGEAPAWTTVSGTLVPGTVRQVYTLTGADAAWRDVVLVDLGETAVFVPQTIHYSMDAPPPSALGAPQAFAARGIWHEASHRNAFSTPDDPAAGKFSAFDPADLAKTLPRDLAAKTDPRVFEPETLVRTDGASPGPVNNPFVRPELESRLTPERHFGYALTWWGLAIGLIGVYLALHHQRGRLRFRGTQNP